MERAPQSGKSRIDDSPSDVPDEHTCKNPVDNPVDSPSVSICFLLPCGAVSYFQLQSLIPIRVKACQTQNHLRAIYSAKLHWHKQSVAVWQDNTDGIVLLQVWKALDPWRALIYLR